MRIVRPARREAPGARLGVLLLLVLSCAVLVSTALSLAGWESRGRLQYGHRSQRASREGSPAINTSGGSVAPVKAQIWGTMREEGAWGDDDGMPQEGGDGGEEGGEGEDGAREEPGGSDSGEQQPAQGSGTEAGSSGEEAQQEGAGEAADAQPAQAGGGAAAAGGSEAAMPGATEVEGVACEVSLDVPKVALLFLTLGFMPHQPLWREWLDQAGGLLPLSALAAPEAVCLKTCGPGGGSCTRQCGAAAACHPACRRQLAALYSAVDPAPLGTGAGEGAQAKAALLQQKRQHLFSIYTHAPPEWRSYPPYSLFAGTLIADRVSTKWGTHSLMVAARALIQAALADPANQWFLLASDTTAPLYPAAALWAQLMSETRSKVNACEGEAGQRQARMSRFMETKNFRKEHWRKSSQWWMIVRRHAELVAADEEVYNSFALHCKVGKDRFMRGGWRDCISDEHLVPSLLAMHGEDSNTTCDYHGATFVDWSGHQAHPASYGPLDISEGLLRRMRSDKEGCTAELSEGVLEAGPRAFLRVEELEEAEQGGKGQCQATLEWRLGEQARDPFSAHRLPPQCDLMARKFARASSQALLRLYHNCTAGLGVLPCRPGEELLGDPAAEAAAAEGAGAGAGGAGDGEQRWPRADRAQVEPEGLAALAQVPRGSMRQWRGRVWNLRGRTQGTAS